MIQSGFLYLLFLVIVGLGTNRCTNEEDTKILPLDEGYKPDHAIEFPHDLHARKLEIDCKYCHNSAIDGKEKGIPAAKICLNCHKQVTGNSPKKKES